MCYKVKEVADMVGISIRTLHHYDQIGLLKPKSVSSAGYRLYTDTDLERLQQILLFKELDFSLQEIKAIIDSKDFDRKHGLITHKELLVEKKKRLEKIILSIETTINLIEGGVKMNKKEMFEGFDMTELEKQKGKYAEEVTQKYGNTDAYKESNKKTSKYTSDDWAIVMSKGDGIFTTLASLMDESPEDSEVQEVVAEWRQHITDNFYNCTLEIFKGLGDLYVQDDRFTANIDKHKLGLADFLSRAIHIYCDNTTCM
jgi:DNA-binding transcriptional MerR regulator